MARAVPQILEVSPRAGVEGGEIVISCEGFDPSAYFRCRVMFGQTRGRLVSASQKRVIAAVPYNAPVSDRTAGVRIECNGRSSQAVPFIIGEKIADNLHPVTNPAIDPDNGSIYVTLSGQRGQKVPVSVFKISPSGEVIPFLSDVMNPTGIAFDREGTMFVTSRYDGTVYRVSPFKEAEAFAKGLGIATGIAFDKEGRMYIGDRNGVIYRLSEIGDAAEFAHLEPSVSAYHMAFGPDGNLYVAGPTVSTYESIMRIGPDGAVSRFYTGLGRPQGLAFDTEGNLYVAASIGGHRGIIRITPAGEAKMVIAGLSLVGLAFDFDGNVIAASTREVYRVPLGIKGYLLAH